MQRKRQQRKGQLLSVLIVLGLIASLGVLLLQGTAQKKSGNLAGLLLPINSKRNTEVDRLTATNILLQERGGAAVAEKKPNQRVAIASLTKIMTTVCLLDALSENDQIMIPSDIFPYLEEQQLAVAGFSAGEEVGAEDLLYGILLPSGGEAALAGAIHAAGSEAAFVQTMNQKAEELGMNDTHFSNVSGVDEPTHYSTAADLMKLLTYALDKPSFYQLFTSLEHQTRPTAEHTEGIYLSSTLLKSGEVLEWEDGQILGGKTGYTYAAGQCLASLARVGGKEYLLILLGAEGTSDSEQINIQETRALYQQIKK